MPMNELPAQDENIRRRVLIPITLTLAACLVAFFLLGRFYLQRDISDDIERKYRTVETLQGELRAQRAEVMDAVLHQLVRNRQLQAAMRSGDREALLRLVQPLFDGLLADHRITHFYFIRPDDTVLLRVHAPQRHGDRIERTTLRLARETGRIASGLELGPLGTFTLRVVLPWQVDGQLLGYLELGEDINQFSRQLSALSHAEMLVALRRDLLVPMVPMTGKVHLADHVVTDESLPGLGLRVASTLGSRQPGTAASLDLTLGGKDYRGRFLPLLDAGRRQVGYLLVLEDVTEPLTDFRRVLATGVGVCLLLGGLLFVSSYLVLGRVERQLGTARLRLVDEIDRTRQANERLQVEVGQRRQAQQALEKAHDELERRVVERTRELDLQNKLLASLIANVPYCVAWKDPRSVYLGCNPGFAGLLGLPPEAVAGRTDEVLPWPAELRSLLRQLESEIRSGGQAVIDREMGCLDPSGSPQFFLASLVPLKDAAGEETGMLSILKEITERKLQERRLREALTETARARDQIAGILASVDDPLFVVDGGGRIVLMNTSARAFLALGEGAGAGGPLDAVIADPDLLGLVRQALAERQGGARFDYRRPNGLRRQDTFQLRTSTIGEKSPFQGMIFLIQDVTEQREMDRLKSEFIATAAHELRTPLATILGYAELLLDQDAFSPQEQQEFLSLIAEKAGFLNELIDDLLDIGRLEAGRPLEMRKSRQQVEELIAPTLAAFRRHHPSYRFECVLDAGEVCLDVDRNRLRQVMENLLGNAVKYSPGGGTITVSGALVAEGYRVTVADEGIGMSPEQVKRAFERFYRADHADTAIHGTGLGLTIVENIIEAHGGRVWIESRPGEGTCVSFVLPMAA